MTSVAWATSAAWILLAAVAATRVVRRRRAYRHVAAMRSPTSRPRAWSSARDLIGSPRRRVLAALVVAVVVFSAPGVAVPVLVAAAGAALGRKRSADRRRRDDADRELAWLVDALSVALSSGLNLVMALDAVARRSSGPVSGALRDVLARMAHGSRLADALDAVTEVRGEALRPLTAVLAHADRYGTPIGDALARLVDDLRRRRQRRAEERARRIPVKLLFPLVLCILPAFGLLTVAPLVAGGLRSLRL